MTKKKTEAKRPMAKVKPAGIKRAGITLDSQTKGKIVAARHRICSALKHEETDGLDLFQLVDVLIEELEDAREVMEGALKIGARRKKQLDDATLALNSERMRSVEEEPFGHAMADAVKRIKELEQELELARVAIRDGASRLDEETRRRREAERDLRSQTTSMDRIASLIDMAGDEVENALSVASPDTAVQYAEVIERLSTAFMCLHGACR